MTTAIEPVVDVGFRLRGDVIPVDHGYSLFAAISRVVPELHKRPDWGVHPIFGEHHERGVLKLQPSSMVKIRLPANDIGRLLPLAGLVLQIENSQVTLAPPQVFPLQPTAYLKARFVTIKGFFDEPEEFGAALKRQLGQIEGLEQKEQKIETAVGARRVMRVGNHTIVGFSVALGGLDAGASIAVQSLGVGGRRHMGAGIFGPQRRR